MTRFGCTGELHKMVRFSCTSEHILYVMKSFVNFAEVSIEYVRRKEDDSRMMWQLVLLSQVPAETSFVLTLDLEMWEPSVSRRSILNPLDSKCVKILAQRQLPVLKLVVQRLKCMLPLVRLLCMGQRSLSLHIKISLPITHHLPSSSTIIYSP